MNELRGFSAIIIVDERIYIFGGDYTANAEYYDIIKNTWTNIQPLPDAREVCGDAYCNGSIYVGGGYCRDS